MSPTKRNHYSACSKYIPAEKKVVVQNLRCLKKIRLPVQKRSFFSYELLTAHLVRSAVAVDLWPTTNNAVEIL